jgi:hypothetical protein
MELKFPDPVSGTTREAAMDSSVYRKHAEDWREIAEHVPAEQRRSAINIAEAWLQLAADIHRLEKRGAQKAPPAPTIH